MSHILDLDRPFVHSGVIIGPGKVDIDAEFHKHGHPQEVADRAFKDLQGKMSDLRGTDPIPVTPEIKQDNSISSVTAASKGTDADTTQRAPAAATSPATAPTKK